MHSSLRAVLRGLGLITALLLTIALILPVFAAAQEGQIDQRGSRFNDPQSPVQRTWVMVPTLSGETEPLYSMKYEYQNKGFYEAEEVKLPPWLMNPAPANPLFRDKALQTSIGPLVGVTTGMSFDGIGNGFVGPAGTYSVGSVPPDTDMAVGTTQVISLDNTAFAVFDKTTGAVLAGPFNYQCAVVVARRQRRLRRRQRRRWRSEVRPVGPALAHHPIRGRLRRNHRPIRAVRRHFDHRRCHRKLAGISVQSQRAQHQDGLSRITPSSASGRTPTP